MNKEKVKSWMIVILALVILIIVGWYLFNSLYDTAYRQGGNDASNLIVQQMVNELNANGFTTIWVNQGNQTIPVRLGVIQDG